MMDKLPDVVPTATIAAAKEHLAKNGLKSADPQKLEAYTVKSFFKAFSKLLGEVGLNGSDQNIHTLASSIAREVFQIVTAKMEETGHHSSGLAPAPAAAASALAVTDPTMEIKPWLEAMLLPRECQPERVAVMAKWIAKQGYRTIGELQEAYREDPDDMRKELTEKCKEPEIDIGAGHVKFLIKQLK